MSRLGAWVVLGAALLAGCSRSPADEVRLYAAASLAPVMDGLVAEHERRTGVAVRASYAASSTLAQQILAGAPPGVFVSASAEWADRVEAAGLAEPSTRAPLASNSLVVVVPRGAAWVPGSLAELADPRIRRIAVGDPGHVPAGRYALSALESAGVADRVRGRFVAAADVRAALSYVERGEVEAGIVYATDAAASDGAAVAFAVPAELHPKVRYPMLLVRGAGPEALRLLEFLRGAEARDALARAGFRLD